MTKSLKIEFESQIALRTRAGVIFFLIPRKIPVIVAQLLGVSPPHIIPVRPLNKGQLKHYEEWENNAK